MNVVHLVGKIQRIIITGQTGQAVAFITLICRRRDRADFINVTAFRQTADYIHLNLTDGDFIEVQGRLHYNSNNKQLEVIAQEVHCIAHGHTWEEVQP